MLTLNSLNHFTTTVLKSSYLLKLVKYGCFFFLPSLMGSVPFLIMILISNFSPTFATTTEKLRLQIFQQDKQLFCLLCLIKCTLCLYLSGEKEVWLSTWGKFIIYFYLRSHVGSWLLKIKPNTSGEGSDFMLASVQFSWVGLESVSGQSIKQRYWSLAHCCIDIIFKWIDSTETEPFKKAKTNYCESKVLWFCLQISLWQPVDWKQRCVSRSHFWVSCRCLFLKSQDRWMNAVWNLT